MTRKNTTPPPSAGFELSGGSVPPPPEGFEIIPAVPSPGARARSDAALSAFGSLSDPFGSAQADVPSGVIAGSALADLKQESEQRRFVANPASQEFSAQRSARLGPFLRRVYAKNLAQPSAKPAPTNPPLTVLTPAPGVAIPMAQEGTPDWQPSGNFAEVGPTAPMMEGALQTGRYISAEAGSINPEEMEYPGLARAYKNVVAPAGEAAAKFLESQYEPENLALLGAFSAVPTGTLAGNIVHAASGAYYGTKMGEAAVEHGTEAIRAAHEGDVPRAVENAVSSLFLAGMAGETIRGSARTGREISQDIGTEVARLSRETEDAYAQKILPQVNPDFGIRAPYVPAQDTGEEIARQIQQSTVPIPPAKVPALQEPVTQPAQSPIAQTADDYLRSIGWTNSPAVQQVEAGEQGLTPEGSGTAHLSNEELARSERFYKRSRNGQLTYLGKQPDASLREGEGIVAIGRDGSMRVVNANGIADQELLEKSTPSIREAQQFVADVARRSGTIAPNGREGTSGGSGELQEPVTRSAAPQPANAEGNGARGEDTANYSPSGAAESVVGEVPRLPQALN